MVERCNPRGISVDSTYAKIKPTLGGYSGKETSMETKKLPRIYPSSFLQDWLHSHGWCKAGLSSQNECPGHREQSKWPGPHPTSLYLKRTFLPWQYAWLEQQDYPVQCGLHL